MCVLSGGTAHAADSLTHDAEGCNLLNVNSDSRIVCVTGDIFTRTFGLVNSMHIDDVKQRSVRVIVRNMVEASLDGDEGNVTVIYQGQPMRWASLPIMNAEKRAIGVAITLAYAHVEERDLLPSRPSRPGAPVTGS